MLLKDDIDKAEWIFQHWEDTAHLEQDVMYSAVVNMHLLNLVEIECRPKRKVRGVKFIVNCVVYFLLSTMAGSS